MVSVRFAMLVLLAAALVVVIMLIATAVQHRRHSAATDPRLCRSCGQSNPSFAAYCRRCGNKL